MDESRNLRGHATSGANLLRMPRGMLKQLPVLSLPLFLLAARGCATLPIQETEQALPLRQTFPRPLEDVWHASLELVKLVRYPLARVEGSVQQGSVLLRTGWKVFPGYSTRSFSQDVWERFTITMVEAQQETTVEVTVVREIRTRSVRGFQIRAAPEEERQRRAQGLLAGLADLLGR